MHLSPLWLLLVGAPLLQAAENTGTKMTVRHVMSGISSEETIYLQGDRKRMEFRNSAGLADGSWASGPQLAAITRCDVGQAFELNLDASEYVTAPYPPKPYTRQEMEAQGLNRIAIPQSAKPTLRIETTTVDTGERKDFFGYLARHVITTRKEIPLAGSHSEAQESVTDGWYIDFDSHLSCDRRLAKGARAHGFIAVLNRPPEKPEFVDIGEAESGFAVRTRTTTKIAYTMPDGSKRQTDSKAETEVTELTQGPVDPGLFEIPHQFKLVQQIERNTRPPSYSSQAMGLWQRFKAKVATIFSL